jgi:hypothetical protein
MKGTLEILGPKSTTMELHREVRLQQEDGHEYGNDQKRTSLVTIFVLILSSFL